MSEELSKALISEIQEHGLKNVAFWSTVAAGLFAIVGGVIGWVFSQKSALATVGKTKAETAAILNDLFQKLETTRTKVNTQSETQSIRLRELLDKIKENDRANLNACREELCRALGAEYLPILKTYLEEIPRLLVGGEPYLRLLEDILPALKTLCSFLEVINHDRLLAKLDSPARFQIRKSEFTVIISRTRSLCPLWKREARDEITAIEARVSPYLRK